MSSNALLRRSTPEEAGENPYARFGLVDNPFPHSPTIVPNSSDPRVNGEIFLAAVRESEQAQFERLLIPGGKGKTYRPIVLMMDLATRSGRGIGKTAFLNYQRRRIMDDLGDCLSGGTAVVLAAHFAPQPSGRTRKFWQLAREIMVALNDCRCLSWALWRLRALEGGLPEDILAQVDPSDPESTLGNDQWLQSKGVELFFSLNPTIERLLRGNGVSETFARVFANHACDPETFRLNHLQHANDFIWRRDGLQLVFDDLPRVFRAAGIDRVLLLVDDSEKIISDQNVYERRGFVDDLRRYFVDGPVGSVFNKTYSILLTVHPQVQELLAPHWGAAGLDRTCPISGAMADDYHVNFKPLQPEATAVPLVMEYLNRYRSRVEAQGSLEPFDEAAVVAALRSRQGVPGPMLTLLRGVLQHAADKGWERVTEEHIKQMDQARLPDKQDSHQEVTLPSVQVDLMGG